MESVVTSHVISDEEKRWIVVGVALNNVLAAALRKVLATELQNWHIFLSNAPLEIHKQDSSKYWRTMPQSNFKLRYENINNNDQKSLSAYDFAVRDPLSLAKLYVQPCMAKFSGIDQTMDISAILSIMCESSPFQISGAAVNAKAVKKEIRNKWAHCNLAEWNQTVFHSAFQSMKELIEKIKLSPEDKNRLCRDLTFWEQEGLKLRFGQAVNCQYLSLIKQEVKVWKNETDKQMNEVVEKIQKMESKLIVRIEEIELCAAENSQELERHSDDIERLKKDQNEAKSSNNVTLSEPGVAIVGDSASVNYHYDHRVVHNFHLTPTTDTCLPGVRKGIETLDLLRTTTPRVDACGDKGYHYFIRIDKGTYMRTNNLRNEIAGKTFELHYSCRDGDHYLATNGYFYIIKGKNYRRVRNMYTDDVAVTYELHPNCRDGDHYLSMDGKFYIIFKDKGVYRRTTNMSKDEKPVEYKLHSSSANGIYYWGVGKYAYTVKGGNWDLHYFSTNNLNHGIKNSGSSFANSVLKFLQ